MLPSYYSKTFKEILEDTREIGYVEVVSHPVVYVTGLPGVRIDEVVMFENGSIGWVTSLLEDMVEILVFSTVPPRTGTQVVRTGSLLQTPVGENLIGHSMDPLGKSLNDNEILEHNEFRFIDKAAPGIEEREKVSDPLETGVAVVDLTIPLGKGQRELVVGDRKTGKTEFLLQTMLMQSRRGTICIYACIGKKKIDIKKVENFIQKNHLENTCMIIASSSSDPAGTIFITPYCAMTIAEYFKDNGRDVLIILDDLTTHAKFYREISLLSKKFPGRLSYPGNIFYTHSRLLERAGHFITKNGTNTITCLPVAETQEGDISGFIQTNIMSITDGHVFFDTSLFDMGRRPAINYFLSVTRVGRQTQTKLRWAVSRELLSFLSLYDRTQDFIHFGAEINEGITSTLNMGDKILSFFNQPMGHVLDINLQIVLFSLVWVGALSGEDSTQIRVIFEKAVMSYEKNEQFKKKVDDLVATSDDLNVLLGKISGSLPEIMSYLS